MRSGWLGWRPIFRNGLTTRNHPESSRSARKMAVASNTTSSQRWWKSIVKKMFFLCWHHTFMIFYSLKSVNISIVSTCSFSTSFRVVFVMCWSTERPHRPLRINDGMFFKESPPSGPPAAHVRRKSWTTLIPALPPRPHGLASQTSDFDMALLWLKHQKLGTLNHMRYPLHRY